MPIDRDRFLSSEKVVTAPLLAARGGDGMIHEYKKFDVNPLSFSFRQNDCMVIS